MSRHQREVWFAYFVAEATRPGGGNGRDAMRILQSRWEQCGFDADEWPRFEKFVIRDECVISMRVRDIALRAVKYFAGDLVEET